VSAAQEVVEQLTEAILEALPDAEQAEKWGRLTFTREGDWHHWICAISSTKKATKLVLHKGALLADPQDVMEGEGEYTRSIAFDSPEQVDPEVLRPILREAADRQREMR
jgi:hypothetical protein